MENINRMNNLKRGIDSLVLVALLRLMFTETLDVKKL